MRVFITGANGFVGRHLCAFLIKEGHEVTALVRGEGRARVLPHEVKLIIGESTKPGKWQESVPNHNLLINLAGATAFKRWNDSYKKLLRDSRILTTKNLVDAIVDGKSTTLVSTSGVGYYGFCGDETLDEASPQGNDFFATLAGDWEAEAFKARSKGVRVVTTRFGVAMGADGGALAQMALPFRFFVGGPLGDGMQWVSWIHIDDLCRAELFVANDSAVDGPVNFAAPEPLRNKDLARAIGKVLGRPSFMPAPGFLISLILGEFGSVILKGQRVAPGVLLSRGFGFRYPGMKETLRNLLLGESSGLG